jgi:glycerol-3-phosphate acyltransferase PlsX
MAGQIALDVMGGDSAPRATLAGAVRAVERGLSPDRVLLVGDEPRIKAGLAELQCEAPFAVLHASEVIAMGESPSQALRGKPDSSIVKGVGAVREGAAGAFVSMGNTGAVVGASTMGLGTLEGVRRPGIAVTLELGGSPVTLMDMGANIAPKAAHLVQYAQMGSIFMRKLFAVERPRVGLLNIGEESSKGTDLLREAHGLLSSSGLEFVGNVEGADVFLDRADVVIADGFTGNVVLKFLEGFSGFMLQLVLTELERHDVQWSAKAVQNVKKHIDYAEYGGALLLGVNGTVIVGHGRSDAAAVANALAFAAKAMDARVNEHIVAGLAG